MINVSEKNKAGWECWDRTQPLNRVAREGITEEISEQVSEEREAISQVN